MSNNKQPTAKAASIISYRVLDRKAMRDSYEVLDTKTLAGMYSQQQSLLNNLLAQLNDERTTQDEAQETIRTIMCVRQIRAEIYWGLQNKK
tara:strand:+ start:1136 stop:1408 length:273 start_codon:yes stop_codon:yes gene_type:complete